MDTLHRAGFIRRAAEEKARMDKQFADHTYERTVARVAERLGLSDTGQLVNELAVNDLAGTRRRCDVNKPTRLVV